MDRLPKLLPAVRAVLIGAWVGLICGLASALFLSSLDRVTHLREMRPSLLFALPFLGLVVVAMYRQFGSKVARGTDLLLERVHDPEGELPVRMAPLVLLGTLLTHLGGGSAGREGTAVQMGGSLGLAGVSPFRLDAEGRRQALVAGLAGGFASVFGTPLAGAVFGMEVLTLGRVRTGDLVPCLTAALAGDLVCRATGIDHGLLTAGAVGNSRELLVAVGVGVLCALASRGFVWMTETVSHRLGVLPWFAKPLIGGGFVVAGTLALGTSKYLGLSLGLLPDALSPAGANGFEGPLKLVFTAVTLGAGFKGGEVTPLFVSGASIGSWFGRLCGVDPSRMGAAGFVALFGAAANVPLTAWLMLIERFGASVATPAAIAVGVAYALSAHRGIYRTQLIEIPKR